MSTLLNLSTLALRGLVAGACQAIGLAAGESAAEPVSRFLGDRFVNQGERLTKALEMANDRAWAALEYALAGETLWERCTARFARADDKAFRTQVRAFLDAVPAGAVAEETPEFRRLALAELRLARREGYLRVSALDVRQLALRAGRFAAFASPLALLAAEKQALAELARSFPGDHLTHLRRLLEMTPAEGPPLLVAAVRYFFRRAVEEDRELFQGLAFLLLEKQSDVLETGLGRLADLLAHHEGCLQQLMDEVLVVATDTYREVQQIGQKLDVLLERHRVGTVLRPDDSLLAISDEERRLVRDLVRRYRALPCDQREARLELAFKVGAAEAIAGDYAGAQREFHLAADRTFDASQQAEAHASAFQAALAERSFDAALASLLEAARLDGERFVPFPLDKYQPQRILGAGGFGAAFLCRHAFKRDSVVVKALWTAGLDRTIDEVFNEAQVLAGMNHPAVVQVIDCDFADRSKRSRPYVVMEYFDGPSLADHVAEHGPLSAEEFLPLARQIAEGLQAAHARGILHRDVKPANLLISSVVRNPLPVAPAGAAPRVNNGQRATNYGQVKLIDFGLALRPATLAVSRATTAQARQSLLSTSIAGTWKYAAPEQLGEMNGVPVAAASDVYAFGRTCYFALLGTPDPDDDEKDSLPEGWKKLLGRCAARRVDRRPASFAEVLHELDRLVHGGVEPALVCTPPELRELPSLEPLPALPALSLPARRARPRPPARPEQLAATTGPSATMTATLPGHTATVSVVAISPDGRTLATGSFDHRVRLWSFPDGAAGAWLMGHDGDVNGLAFHPTAGVLASCGDDRTVRLWKLHGEPECLRVLRHPDRVYSVAFSSDGRTLLSGCDDSLVRLWDASTGALQASLAAHAGFVRHVAFSPDGRWLASASGDRTARLWHARDGRPHVILHGHAHTVWSVAFSPDGRLLATTSQDRTTRIWNVADGELLRTLEGHGDIVWCAAFHPDGRYLATASHDKTVRLWDLPGGKHRATLEGHTALVRYLAFSTDGRHLATAGGDQTARVWLLHDAGAACDWSVGEPLLPPRPKVTLTHAGHGVIYPGDELWLEVVVENAGKGDLVQLHAAIESEAAPLRRLSVLFGRVKPGEKVSRCLAAVLPGDQPPGELRGELVFHEANGYEPPPQEVRFSVRPFPRDDLPVSWRLADDGSGNSFGNGDGKPQRGECLDVVVSVTNETGLALEGIRLLLVPIDLPAGVVINIPRVDLPALPDGGRCEGRLTFSVKPSAATGPARMELRVEARDGRLFAVLPVETEVE